MTVDIKGRVRTAHSHYFRTGMTLILLSSATLLAHSLLTRGHAM